MKKRKKVKIKLKLKNIMLFLISILSITLFFYVILNKKINNIYISGNYFLKEYEILELMNYDDYKKYYEINTNNLEKRLKVSPFIKDVSIKKSLLSLKINVIEYKILWYQEYDNSVMLENGKSVYLERRILGLPTLINQIDEEYLQEFINGLIKINKEISTKISEISYDPTEIDKERFLLYMNDHNYVYITLSRIEYLNKYNELSKELNGKKGILYLDSGNYFEIKDGK